ncbi:MAG: metallopeptidase family protein [candidate division NC10 bacterium]|nr:metallopeptidase family protein [candidate division NC10 bacterium]MBI2919343.1 metallopeptidase family protein [Chloroflexota bacterium]MBI2114851.1 metallopeptidase family protein [candidate division NC10 bacterium]MBI2163265.1 metallopeptidase family protein [candidate division NC10 bacterium]MBI2457443.1 metallopeptidase family protein [candidate division NC10 bacterium]
MARLSRAEFEKLVTQAVESLPPRFLERLENVEVMVESAPTREDLEVAGIEPGGTLFGLYQGVPQTQRGTWYGSVLPDRIVIYQRPIEAAARTRREIRKEIRITLMHEIGHHFGLGEDELSEAGYE